LEIGEFLGWRTWIWYFTWLKDFIWNNGGASFEDFLDHSLWTLHIPEQEIKWCSLDRHCEGFEAAQQFAPSPYEIEVRGEIPIALVQTPINPAKVIEIGQTGEVFKMAGLIEY
jgi:hypothetical protein